VHDAFVLAEILKHPRVDLKRGVFHGVTQQYQPSPLNRAHPETNPKLSLHQALTLFTHLRRPEAKAVADRSIKAGAIFSGLGPEDNKWEQEARKYIDWSMEMDDLEVSWVQKEVHRIRSAVEKAADLLRS
jgi:hypothetical protein